MSRNHTFCLHLLVVVLLATACSSPRKASERDCAKAEKHRARALWLCPPMLHMDSASIRLHLPGDSTSGTARYTDVQVDSIKAACEQYAAALAAERELYIIAQRDQHAQGVTTPTLHPPPTQPSLAPAQALHTIRRHACAFDPFTATTGLCVATVRPGPNGPLITLEQLPLDTTAKAPCPPSVKPAPCPTCTGVASWYRWAFWITLPITLLLAAFVLRVIVVSMRANSPHG